MSMRSLRPTITGLVASGLLVLLTACGGGAGASPPTTDPPAGTETAAPLPQPLTTPTAGPETAAPLPQPLTTPTAVTETACSAVSGHTFDQQGAPIGGVEILVRIVPLNSGLGTFQTTTAADGSYSRDVPDGVYQVNAATPDQTNDQGEIQVGTDLTPLQDNAITVPPCAVVDFQLQ